MSGASVKAQPVLIRHFQVLFLGCYGNTGDINSTCHTNCLWGTAAGSFYNKAKELLTLQRGIKQVSTLEPFLFSLPSCRF